MPERKSGKKKPGVKSGVKKPVQKPAGQQPVQKTGIKGTVRKAEKKPGVRKVVDLLPELLVKALARHDDFIITCETDPDTEKKVLHIISGKFVTPCMLRKLEGQAEAQRDEGSVFLSRKWQ